MGGKSLILAHQLHDKNVLVVGGGEVALTRLKKLISTGTRVTLVSPEIHPTILKEYCGFVGQSTETDVIDDDWKAGQGVYRVIRDHFKMEYLTLYTKGNDSGWSLILTCIPNKPLSEEIYHESKRRFGSQQTVNVADNPPLCDVYFGANLEFGNGQGSSMQMMISSNGMGPRYVALVRDEIKSMLEGIDFEGSLKNLGELRSRVREIAHEDSDTKYRMNWMKSCTENFGIKNCEKMDVDKLVQLFDKMYVDDRNMIFPSRDTMIEQYMKESNSK